ncbi:hypothetical protein GBA52_028056 [Prunus armeniaca]|nr:hypothetical protein GBA52_028056 [Prunus armeniaca]
MKAWAKKIIQREVMGSTFNDRNLDWILLKPEAGLILGKQGHFPFPDEKRLVKMGPQVHY